MRYTSFLRGSFLATCHVGVAEFACVHEVCPWEATGTASSSLIQVSDGRPRGKAKGRQEPEVAEEVPAAADDNILREELRNVRFNPFRRFHQVSFTVMIQVLIAFVAFGASRSMRWYLSPKGSEGEWTATWTPRQFLDEGKRDSPTYIPLDVDIYGAAVSSCIRDMQVLSLGSHHNADESIRSFRVVASLTMLWACMAAQGFISYMVASELSSVVVLKFRRLYDSFEVAVYAPESLTLTSNGFHRGIPAGFQPVGFADLAPSQMHTICQMPFANDMFLLIILFIWTLSCVVDLRRALCMLMDFTVTMPVAALKDATVVAEGDDGEVGEVTIVGIPMEMRAFLTAVIFIPRLVLDFVILFLGCRWLLSTSDMGDLILNAVALEFLLVLNSLVLQALVPVHGVNGLERTKAISSSSRHESAVMALLATLSWALFASSWCIFYVYFIEDVLPDYQWDVHAICNAWQNAIRRSK